MAPGAWGVWTGVWGMRTPVSAGALDALDGLDAIEAFDGANDVGELLQVRDSDLEGIDRALVPGGAAVGLADVDALLAEDGGHLGKNPRSVHGENSERDRPLVVPVDVPGHVHSALGVSGQRPLAADGVHRHAAAASDEADNRVARNRIAAPSKAHQDVVHTTDLDTRLASVPDQSASDFRHSAESARGRR